MKIFELRYKDFCIFCDEFYGVRGWSIAIKDSYYVQFEKTLIVALYRAYKHYKKVHKK